MGGISFLPMRRFFIDPAGISGSTGIISGPEARHISLVLRLGTGQRVELFDGKGNIYQAIIQGVNKDKISVKIIAKKIFIDNGPQIYLGQALLKGKKMDLLIQKATELGIHAIHPFVSCYCAKRSSVSRNKRWDKISLEACKQCGRPLPPDCRPVQEFSKIISNASNCSEKIIFWEKETKNRLTPQIAKHESIFFLVGPEGGFSSEEIDEARNHGFQTVTLGPRTLRAETAALCAMSIIQFLTGI
jgi:16S rRNA (uracil1498-N3)-methyltransferase